MLREVLETMSADTTEYKHLCPFCDVKKGTDKKVRRHVTQSEEGDHYKVNGFKMDRTIKTVKVDNKSDRMQDIGKVSDAESLDVQSTDINDKIVEATKRVSSLDNSGITKIADKADVSNQRVLRILRDNNINHDWNGATGAIEWSDLTNKQKEVLSYYYKNKGCNVPEIARNTNADIHKTDGYKILEKYEWLLLDEYRPDDSVIEDTGSNTIENDTDELVDVYKSATSSNENEENDLINKLASAGVEFEVDVKILDDDFDAIQKLIESGHKDLAEDIHNSDI